MLKIFFLTIQFGLSLLISPLLMAESCQTIIPFSKQGSSKVIQIQVLEGTNEITPVIQVLLKEYLELNKNIQVSFSPTPPPVYILEINLMSSTGLLTLRNVSHPEKEMLKLEMPISLNNTEQLNEKMAEVVQKIAEAVKEKLPYKKVAPFFNSTSSSQAYQMYAQAVLSLSRKEVWDQAFLETILIQLQKTIETDYNYVPAYLRLAETLSALARLKSDTSLKQKAQTEFDKAKILLPPLAEMSESRFNWYYNKKEACRP